MANDYYWFDGPYSPSFEELFSDIEGTPSLLFLIIDDYAAICYFVNYFITESDDISSDNNAENEVEEEENDVQSEDEASTSESDED